MDSIGQVEDGLVRVSSVTAPSFMSNYHLSVCGHCRIPEGKRMSLISLSEKSNPE